MKKDNLIIDGVELTPRDQQIISYTIRNISNKLMSEAFGISEETLKTEVRILHAKIRQPNRVGVTIYGLNHGWDTQGVFHPEKLNPDKTFTGNHPVAVAPFE